MNRQTWPEARISGRFAGKWVALDECRYEGRSREPVDGIVVDSDEDLVELCSRMDESDSRHCVLCFCRDEGGHPWAESEASPPASTVRPRGRIETPERPAAATTSARAGLRFFRPFR
jgi:hypothetical protein